MPTTYRATLTEVGAALVADAIASGTTLTWAKMALGDGNGSTVTVDPSRTSLVNEQYRAPLNDLGRDSANPNTIVGTLVVPPETGGWTIREFGIYDNASTPRLVAYGETPEIEKPASSAGTGINLRLRFKLVVSAEANITLAPDSNEAYATIEYVKDNAVKSLSVSGCTITYTMGDGDTHTIQTQDTTYEDATQSEHGLMSANDKTKLDGISAGAEVNQNAFASVLVGNTNVAADTKTDTLTLVAGNNVTLTPDATNDKITIAAQDTVTTVNTTGNGNAITSITANNGKLTVKKNSTFSLSDHTHNYAGSSSSGGTATKALNADNGAEIGMKLGTTYNTYTTQCAGYVTSNKKSLVFTIPVQRLFPDISWNASNPTLNLTLIRIYPSGGSGYVDGLADGTVSKGYCAGGIRVEVAYSTALGGAITNNSCVTVVIQGSIQFS